jgi:WD40 repeat protein
MRWFLVFVSVLLLSANCAVISDTLPSRLRYPNIEIDTGHQDSVLAIQYDDRRDLLLTGSADGTIKIWEPESGTLLHSLLVSHLPVQRFAFHPSQPLIAVLEVYGPDTASVGVWNWQSKAQLYRIEMTDVPLCFTFSPQGTYLITCQADWNSINVYNGKTGKVRPLMNDGFGIVSFVTVSQSEKNIMTYQPSGRLTYWELETGKEIKVVETLPNLSLARISHNRRYMMAQTDERLVILDLLSGRIKASTQLTRIKSLTISQDDRTIVCLTDDRDAPMISSWLFTGDDLYELESSQAVISGLPQQITSIATRNDDLLLGDGNGTLWVKNHSGNVCKLSQNNLLDISDLSVREDTVALASPDVIVSFHLDIGEYATRLDSIITSYSYSRYSNPFSTPIGLRFLNGQNLLLWDKSEEHRGISVLNLFSGYTQRQYSNFSAPQIQVDLAEGRILSLEKNGLLRLLEINTYSSLFEYLSPGLRKIVSAGEDNLIGARSQMSGFSGSLIRIDSRTGETVPLTDSSLLTYDLVYEKSNNTLYTLSIDRRDGQTVTCIKRHFGEGLEKTEAVVRYVGEDLSASLDYDTTDKILYTSLGYAEVRSWDGQSVEIFQATRHVPRYLKAAGRLLYSLNKDSTITIWDRTSRKIILDLYLFKDYSWIAIFPNEKAYISQGADQFLILTGKRKKIS